MADQFLSQDEVDALLEGVTGESQALESDEPADGIREYRLESQERIVRGRMPTLEIVNERFARNFRIGLFNFMRKSANVSAGPVRVIKYSAFLRDIVVPTNINVISITPLRGSGLVIFDPKLVFAVIDTLFGGSGAMQFHIEGRDFSPTEQRIIQRMVEVVLAEYTRAWGALFPFKFAHLRSEMQPQFASIASTSEIVVATTFTIEIGDASGEVHICFPYSSLEPIRDILYSTVQGDGHEPDTRWLRNLTQQVQDADVELVAELAGVRITVGELRQLRAGDFVPLQLKEVIRVKVGGVPVMECRFGTLNGRVALRVEQLLKYSHMNDRRDPAKP